MIDRQTIRGLLDVILGIREAIRRKAAISGTRTDVCVAAKARRHEP